MKIEIHSKEKDLILEHIFESGIDEIQLGRTKNISEETDFVFLQGNEENLIGIPTILLVMKLATMKLGTNTVAIICSLAAAAIYDALKKVGEAILMIEDKKVEIDKETIAAVIEAYIKQTQELGDRGIH